MRGNLETLGSTGDPHSVDYGACGGEHRGIKGLETICG